MGSIIDLKKRTLRPNGHFFTNVKSIGGFPKMEYNILHATPNYQELYTKMINNEPDKITRYILLTFSKHQPRVLEQALQSHFSPLLNSPRDVILEYGGWTEDMILKGNGLNSYTILAKSQDNNVYEFSSIKQASPRGRLPGN